MTETKIYVGLADATTMRKEHTTEEYLSILNIVCTSYHVSFTFFLTQGGYFMENGDYVRERTLVLTLIDAEKGIIDAIARDLCAFFHQEKVLITENQVRAYYVQEELPIYIQNK